jgi:phospholipid-binding lipoprotein MlaA
MKPTLTKVRGSATLAVLMLALAGCATTAAPQRAREPSKGDPLERMNRATFNFNQKLDRAVLRPVVKVYRKVTPKVVRTGISNFYANAKYPVVIVNDVLQGKFVPAFSDTGRFVMNTTIGIAGLLDPATAVGLDVNDEDFGQTLGKWGMHPGPYIVVPALGPFTLRDGFGALADTYAQPTHYLSSSNTRYGLLAGELLDRRSRLTETDAILDRTGDPYAFVRSAYLQRREYLVRDGALPAEEEPLEDPEPPAEGSPDAPPPATAPAPAP